MGHFAKVFQGKVQQVIVAEPDFFNVLVDTTPGFWVQTSYNTLGNVHYGADGQPDGGRAVRGNFAGIGYTYDHTNDVFYPPRPYSSWTISEATNWMWKAPVDYPAEGHYTWDETRQNWTPLEST